ncbi:hypothetical protein THRCLA_01000 [Thraustotheca clavata]|uniref:procollagen-lysine 5-dioxygenase n=1 Tax=Thraustotheca clavata TaxID=74557 RepID=A0A1W0A9K5_9STRA|nr:hypothetical protein THRCLA_01000 [Thraustotheca clavata]
MTRTSASLLDKLSPQLLHLVENTLGQTISSTPSSSPSSISVSLNPSEIFVLSNPSSPGFIVRERLLGSEESNAVYQACLELKGSSTLRPAQVGLGQANDVNYVKNARGDQLLWLPHDPANLPLPIQRLLRRIEQLVHGVAKHAPSMGIRNIRSTQFALFVSFFYKQLLFKADSSRRSLTLPGNGARFVKHLDTYKTNGRLITCLYYLNPSWTQGDGGELRLHLANNQTWDVAPHLDTLVVFRSTDVYHEVLPAIKDRMAFTIWYYGSNDNSSTNSIKTIEAPAPLPNPTAPIQQQNTIEDQENPTIFVSIASYRDSECQPTVENLFATAKYPKRIHVGICMQTTSEDDVAFLKKPSSWIKNVKVHFMDAKHATGPCYARFQTQQLFNDETYYLQIDSHMRFRQDWDVYLIYQLDQCPSTKAILTTYPMGYELPNKVPNDVRPTLLCATNNFAPDGLVRQCAKVLKHPTATPLRSAFWAAGFAFSRGDVVTQVPYDGALSYVFFGEEQVMAARLFTHGYDFFAPCKSVVYHLWSRAHRPSFRSQILTPEQQALAKQANNYVLKVLRGDDLTIEERNHFKGPGEIRSLDDFYLLTGINYKSQNIEWSSLWGSRDPINFDTSVLSA